MKQFINPESSKSYQTKTPAQQSLINICLFILSKLGIPLENLSNRRLERLALTFLATGDVKRKEDLKNIKDLEQGYFVKTREIIRYINQYFNENISPGSYDDIRRKDLKLLTTSKIVLQSNPSLATNDSTRGYAINPFFADIIRRYGEEKWDDYVQEKLKNIELLNKKLKRERDLQKFEVKLPQGLNILLSLGEHNELQKSIIEELLPRYGFDSEVLYIGDTSNKFLFINEEKLTELNFFKISHEELPDIIAYSEQRNWLYLIEAVHSSGPISELRLLQLKNLTQDCKADIIYITAFQNRTKFRQFIQDIAWETEVWIAENPEHLIHFNGDKFLGPYKS